MAAMAADALRCRWLPLPRASRRRASRCWRSETENVGNKDYFDVSDPLKGEAFRQMPNTMEDEVNAFSVSAGACPKRGL